MIKLIDLYSGNTFNPEKIKAEGYTGVVFKGGQGELADVPRLAPDWWKRAGDWGLMRGWYWIGDSRIHSSNHIASVKRWLSVEQCNQELGFWVDTEKPSMSWTDANYYNPNAPYYSKYAGYKNVVDFLYLLTVYGVTPGVYTSPGAYNLILKPAPDYLQTYLAGFKLWTAQYPWLYVPGVSKPTMYGKWARWEFWQYREGPDINLYNGTDEQFWSSYNYQNPPPEPPPVEPPPVEPPVEPPPVVITTERFARLRHDNPPRQIVINGKLLSVAPETVPMQDAPIGVGKGARIRYDSKWLKFLRILNPGDNEYNWITKIGQMLFNPPQNDAPAILKAEAISCGGNIVWVVEERDGHARIKTLGTADTPPAMTYFTHPWIIQKATAVRAAPPLTIYKAGEGRNVYFPLLTGKAERWVCVNEIEYFPPLPCSVTVKYPLNVRAVPSVAGLKVSQYYSGNAIAITEYAPRGGDVWGKTDRGWVALLYKGNRYTSWSMVTSAPPE